MDAILIALSEVVEPMRLLMLGAGVVFGLIVGVIPGIGGIFGMSLLLPLSYALDPFSAFALLLGMASVTTTSDTIPAVLLGVPGTVGAITTVVDGYPMAQRGEQDRALGAAFMSSLIGGLFGAAVLASLLPVLRPVILSLQTSDFFAICCAGLFFVATVSGPDPLKGLAALCLGGLLSFVGLDAVTASERLTGDFQYLWDGLPITVVFLGLFAVPEIISLLERPPSTMRNSQSSRKAMWGGAREAIKHWRIILRSSVIGSVIGAVPGVGVTVIDWLAYGVEARRKPKDPDEPLFGEGNLRGIIAPESANNAKEGGYLIPTLAIGVPGSPSMALLLSAFMIHGLAPGPTMLTENLPITISFVLFIALANVLGTGLCLIFASRMARLAHLPAATTIPILVSLITLGAFQARNDVGDFLVLIAVALLAEILRKLSWPRAALSLGFVLGPVIERYFFLAMQTTDGPLLARPSIAMLVLVLMVVIVRAILRQISKDDARCAMPRRPARNDALLALVMLTAAIWALTTLAALPWEAQLFPSAVCILLAGAAGLICLRVKISSAGSKPVHDERVGRGTNNRPTMLVFSGITMCFALIYFAGPYPAVFATVTVAGRLAGRPLNIASKQAMLAAGFAFVIFDIIGNTHWPTPVISTNYFLDLLPAESQAR